MNEKNISQSIKSIKLGTIINLKSSARIPKFSSHKKNNIYDFNPFTAEDTINNIYHSYNKEIIPDDLKKIQMTYFVNKKTDIFDNKNKINDNLHKSRKINYKNKKVKFISLSENENKKKQDIIKPIIKKGKNLKLFIHSEEKNRKGNVNLNDNNPNIILDNKENNLYKNLYYIKTPQAINNNPISINNSINALSIKQQITNESTKSISNQNTPQGKGISIYNRLIKTKLNKTAYKTKLQISQNNSDIKFEDKLKDAKSYNEIMKVRMKYPFILKQNPLLPKKFIDLPKNIKRTNKIYFDIVKNENDKLFSQYFSIVSKEKFSKKFQNIGNPLDFEKIYEQNNINDENTIFKEKNDNEVIYNSLINEKIVSGYRLLKEIKIKKNDILKIKAKLTKKNLFRKFKKALIFLSSKLSNIKNNYILLIIL